MPKDQNLDAEYPVMPDYEPMLPDQCPRQYQKCMKYYNDFLKIDQVESEHNSMSLNKLYSGCFNAKEKEKIREYHWLCKRENYS